MAELLDIKNYDLASASFVQAGSTESVHAHGCASLAFQMAATITTPDPVIFASGTKEVQTITFPSVAGSTAGDYFVVTDTNGLTWAAALNKTGADPAPTGPIYTAIPAGRKVNVDISGGTDAASVAALVETAIDALTGFSAVLVTDDSAANGTMTFTGVNAGNVANASVHNANDSGAGSIAQTTTTPGVDGVVNIIDNEITVTAHGLLTGNKGQLTTAGVLPTGLSASTDYFVIVVDANTIQFATTLDNANDGTAVNITTTGNGNQTFTSTALAGANVKLQKSLDGVTWFDDTSATNITGAGGVFLSATSPVNGQYYKATIAITAGEVTLATKVLGKGIV